MLILSYEGNFFFKKSFKDISENLKEFAPFINLFLSPNSFWVNCLLLFGMLNLDHEMTMKQDNDHLSLRPLF